MISFTIPMPPRTKKNHQNIYVNPKTKRPFVSTSSAYKAYEKGAMMTIPNDVRQQIDYPVNVTAVFYMDTHRKVDLPNLQECLLDVLVKAGVLQDDNSRIVASMDGSCVSYDKDKPRTYVEITRRWD